MPALSDHVRRDADATSRALIGIELGRYRRRMEEMAKGHVKEAIEEATSSGEAIDGLDLGRAAATEAVRAYIRPGEPQPLVEAGPAASGD